MQQYTIEGVVVMIEASGGGGRQCLHRWQQDLVGGGRNNQRNEERENEREKEREGCRGWNVVKLVADGERNDDGDEWKEWESWVWCRWGKRRGRRMILSPKKGVGRLEIKKWGEWKIERAMEKRKKGREWGSVVMWGYGGRWR